MLVSYGPGSSAFIIFDFPNHQIVTFYIVPISLFLLIFVLKCFIFFSLQDILHGNEQNSYYGNNYNTNSNNTNNSNVASNGTGPSSNTSLNNTIQTLSNLHPQQAQYRESC